MAFLLQLSVLIAALHYIAAGPVDEAKQMLQTELLTYEKCGKENNIAEAELERIISHYEIADTRNAKCLASCHLRGMKMMSEDGVVNWDRVDEIHQIEYVKPEDDAKALEVTKACRNSVKGTADHCDTAYLALKCFLDNAKKANLHLLGTEDLQ
uniref:Odorant-binding protein 7 n=1 Tax=Riptortus pedestris TaxID=329032 RepID=A0A2Z4HQ26_RIPPE|nr:odorant-binding protein 7 [Riptortus pedestris]